jgi:hypothetical protein
MMMKKPLVGAAICAASIVGLSGAAFAGESTGSNRGGPAGDGVTGAYDNGNSPCLFSGLEDNDGAGTDPSSGETQNWGHTKDFVGGGGANGPIVTPHGIDGCNARDFGLKD